MEYPGYSVYPGEPNANKILEDSLILYDFLAKKVNVPSQDIIIFGRSIGTGPATYLAAKRESIALLLMSPYTSIKKVVKEVAGKFASFVIRDRFKNAEEIQKVKCPILFIHGKRDTLIPYTHSEELAKKVKVNFEKQISEYMTHNDFSMENDITNPIIEIFKKYDIKINTGEKKYELSKELFEKPETAIVAQKKKSFFVKIINKVIG